MVVSLPATVITLVGAVVVVTGGMMGIFVFPKIIKDQVEQTTILEEGTDKFYYWETSKVPVIFKMYFFNVTNAEEAQKGAKPEVKEIGPYVYNQYKKKLNITHTDDVISFHQYQVYEFDEKASAPLRDTDELTIVNLPLMAMLLTAESEAGALGFFSLGTVNSNIPKIFSDPTSIFSTTTPREFLFDGIPLMCNGTSFFSTERLVCNNIEQHAPKMMTLSRDGIFRFSLFGWKNNTQVDTFSINTGTTDIYKIGETSAWQGSSSMDLWPRGGTCNEISGTDGGLFPPFRTSESVLKVFNPDICRRVDAHYYEKGMISGIETNRYLVDEKMFDSPSNNSANKCFCLDRANILVGSDGCLLDGVLDVFECQGAAVIFSFPHFYRAHEQYQNGVDGLHPNESIHRMFLDLEPISGTVLHAARKVQLNVFVKPIDYISLTADLRTTLMPIVWVEESYDAGDEIIAVLNAKLFSVLDLVSHIKWGIIAGGTILFAFGLIWMLRSMYGPAGFRKLNLIISEKSGHINS